MEMKAIFIVLLTFTLHSCGGALTSAALIESFLSPTSIAMTLADYGIEKETGKKVSEHALSIATEKDCKLTFDVKNICKDDNFFENITTQVAQNIRNFYTKKID
ncbi:MAG: hypothetical protein EBV74_05730 [Alphaproteobacteria bacterium]|nr:hypothetical protein [Candidatus Fonsibacter sp. PEL55]